MEQRLSKAHRDEGQAHVSAQRGFQCCYFRAL